MIILGNKKAFTLAEVLITLGIIGVVAAITMPVLIQNYKKSVYVNQLKKTYSTISQGFTKMLSDEEVYDFQNTQIYNAIISSDKNTVDNIMQKYFHVQTCDDTSCNIETENAAGPTIFGMAYSEFTSAYLLNDGSAIQLVYNSAHHDGLIDINVDINGYKKPNRYGRDVYRFAIDSHSKIVPWCDSSAPTICYLNGSDGSPCNTSSVNNWEGWACAEKIIAEGWKMNY